LNIELFSKNTVIFLRSRFALYDHPRKYRQNDLSPDTTRVGYQPKKPFQPLWIVIFLDEQDRPQIDRKPLEELIDILPALKGEDSKSGG
jgi:hypothetical protein